MIDLSFVIIGRNAEWSIARLLDSIRAEVPAELSSEIIYVDSASSDRSIEIVSRYPATILQLSADQPLCASAGRFVGARQARGKYIYFLDSDMELVPGWLLRALRHLDVTPGIAAITGIIVDVDRSRETDARSPVDLSKFSEPSLTDVKYAGAAAIFRRAVLSEVGTWNPHIISDEEPELCLRLRHANHRVVRLEYPVTLHYTAPYFAISTLFGRRRRRLFLGFGQTIRSLLTDRLLLPYLAERGFMLPALAAVLLAISSVGLSVALKSAIWMEGFLLAFVAVVLADAIRTRSFSRPFFHLVHRGLILEGTIRGFFLPAPQRDEYRGNVTTIRSMP